MSAEPVGAGIGGILETPSCPLEPEQIRPDTTNGTAGQASTTAQVKTTAPPWRVCICDTQPLIAEGIQTLASKNPDLEFVAALESLASAAEAARAGAADVLILDSALGAPAVHRWLRDWTTCPEYDARLGVVIWGESISEQDAQRYLQDGARGVLRKNAGVDSVLLCVRAVARGGAWVDVVRTARAPIPTEEERGGQAVLTSREQEVLQLIEMGLRNKDIAAHLGIQLGTVKIHVKNILVKTGAENRFGLRLRVFRKLPAAG